MANQLKVLGVEIEQGRGGADEEPGWVLRADFNDALFGHSDWAADVKNACINFPYSLVTPVSTDTPEILGNMVKMWYPTMEAAEDAETRIWKLHPVCEMCETKKVISMGWAPVWLKEAPPGTGSGRNQRVEIMHCPKCDPDPRADPIMMSMDEDT